MDGQIIPLFSKAFYVKKLEIDTKKIISVMNKTFGSSGTKSTLDVKDISLVSESMFVLEEDKFADLKSELMKEFYIFSNSIMFYPNEFGITTSWFTKTTKNQSSNYHNHHNCMISGIFYLQTDENSGDIVFEDFTNQRNKLIPKEYNIYNSTDYRIKPIDGLLILFPSEVHHKILKSTSDNYRYSLAFNLTPIGKIGTGDSYINMKLL